MYRFYIGKVRVPTPGKLEIKVKSANKIIRLANDGEMNLIRHPGLTEFKFKLVLPMIGAEKSPDFYLKHFEDFMISGKPFRFIVNRTDGSEKEFFRENLNLVGNTAVTLEHLDIVEDANNGSCVEVTVVLKKYEYYGTKEVAIHVDPNGRSFEVMPFFRPRPAGETPRAVQPVTGKENTVHNIARRYGVGKDQVKVVKSNGAVGSTNSIAKDDKVYLDVGISKKNQYNRMNRPVVKWSEVRLDPKQKATALGQAMKNLRKSGKYKNRSTR